MCDFTLFSTFGSPILYRFLILHSAVSKPALEHFHFFQFPDALALTQGRVYCLLVVASENANILRCFLILGSRRTSVCIVVGDFLMAKDTLYLGPEILIPDPLSAGFIYVPKRYDLFNPPNF